MKALSNPAIKQIMADMKVDLMTVLEADVSLANEKGDHTEQEVRERIKERTAYYGPDDPDIVIKIPL